MRETIRKVRMFVAILFLATAVTTFTQPFQALYANCNDLINDYQDKFPLSAIALRDAQAFAVEHGLPMQVLEVGPEGARRKRVFVGLDVTTPGLEAAYMKRFNVDSKPEGIGGYLPLEFQREIGDRYVTGVLRPGADGEAKIYRWGREDMTRPAWKSSYWKEADGIMAFGHVIPITPEQRANLEIYLKDTNMVERAPCKANNCVAWTSSIELGKTAKGTADGDRNFLFSHLGMARASAHFEIGRRLIRAANENHSVVFVFYNGEKGKLAFETELEKNLPPDPKIPYANIIKNVKIGADAAIEKAVKIIPDGAKIFVPIAAGASPEALTALIEQATGVEKGYDVHVLVNGVSESVFRKAADFVAGKFRIHALFLGGNLRKLYTEGKVNVIPGNLADFSRLVGDPEAPQFNYDAMIVRVSKPDAQGRYSLGPNCDHIMTILRKLPGIKIIAEVNENVPFTNGQNFLKREQIASMFESKTALAGPPVVPLTNVEKQIGQNIGGLVPTGATLQLGIGNVFGGLTEGLATKGVRDVKIHTEMFGDVMKDMIDQGIATHAVTGFAYGSEGLYKWLDKNQRVEFRETIEVNDPARIQEIPAFHAVNTALQVDLYGQSNATIGPDGRRMSSPGGQVEFMTGASRSAGGKAIIAIRSTAKAGALSAIVLNLYEGPITTPAESVSHVVTEYGVALMKGQSERQRAINLINIAHPKFRQELFDTAVRKGLVKEVDRAIIRFNVPEVA